MRTIQGHWGSFERAVVPTTASSVQRQEMRRAFYAGAAALMSTLREMDAADLSAEAGAGVLAGVEDELAHFTRAVLAGGA